MHRNYCCHQACLLLGPRTYSSQTSVPLPKREWGNAQGSVNPVKSRLQEIKPSSSPPSSSILSSRRPSSSKLSTRAAKTTNAKTINADEVEVAGDHEGVWRPSLGNANPVDVRPEYLTHRRTLKAEFPNGWSPPRKLSREAMDGLRALHGHDPKMFSTPFLASRFKISPEAVRKILRSKWEPDEKRKAEIAKKEVALREAWIEKKRQEKTEKRQRPVEVLMDDESDRLFVNIGQVGQDSSLEATLPRRT
jgi:Neugrin